LTAGRLGLLPRSREAWLLTLAALGVFLAADDQTSVVAILPQMVETTGLPQDEFFRAAWLVNGYILGYVVAMPLMGRLADSFGHGRVFALALGVFLIGSAWVALSSDLTMLSTARAFQAIGGGAVVPVSMAIVLDVAAPERRALGLGAMAAASEAGGLVGPLWGGGIAELFDSWRWVFWLNLPLCLPIALTIWRLAPRTRLGSVREIDFIGAGLLGLSLVCLTLALTNDPIEPRPGEVTALLFTGAALLFLLFLQRQRLVSRPIVEIARFRGAAWSAGFLTNALAGGALIVAMVNVPLFTNIVLAGSALEGGINLMRLTIALPFGALAGGWLAARAGFSLAAALGLALAGTGFLGMAQWGDSPSGLELTLPLLLAGLGFGLVIAPVNAAVLNQTDEQERATAASLLTVVRLLGALVGVALLTTRGLSGFYAEAGLVPLDDPHFSELIRGLQVDAFQETFIVTAIVCFASMLPALLLSPLPWLRNRPAV
jgi:MFS family permease